MYLSHQLSKYQFSPRKMFSRKTWIWVTAGLFLILFSTQVYAEKNIPSKDQTSAEKKQPELDPLEDRQVNLFLVVKKSVGIRKELVDLSKKASTKEIEDQIKSLQKELETLNNSFETLSTQLHGEEIPKVEEIQISWTDELQEITKPILKSIREITSRPRRIESLNAKIEALKVQIKNYETARKNLNDLDQIKPNALKQAEKSNGEKLEKKDLVNNFKTKLDALYDKYNPEFLVLKLGQAEASLAKIQQSDKSIFGVLAEAFSDFFEVRGRNLFISLASFAGVWWSLFHVYRIFSEKTRFLDALNRPARKIIKASYNFFIFGLAVLAGLLALYLLNDWLLLSMLAMFLIALAWTSRQLLPRFLQELRLILNFGSVREGERLFWKGVPWLVKDLGMYAILMNPRLEGGSIKLPVGELAAEHSRPFVKEEDWFPTEIGNWVILSDDTFGKIISQTPEQVIVEHLGSRKYYLTPEFLTLKPRNLSSGYTLVIKFGLDYGTQDKICEDLPELFKTNLEKYFRDELEATPPAFEKLKVQFDEAGASSLNLIIIAVVNGKYAEEYYSFKRTINKELVSICNENNLTIPFNQMTLSLSPQMEDLAHNAIKEKGSI